MTIIEDNGVEQFAAGQQIQFAHTANNVSGVLAVACGASDTTITLSPGGGALFPNAPFYCSIEFEVIWCLSKSGDSLIVQRGQDGTAATTHAIGVSVEMRNNAGLWTDAYNAINSVSADVGTLATNVMNKSALPPDTTFQDNVQSFTHKTIDLTDANKANVIIGNVSPDPAQLVYQNLLNNGGFEEWSVAPSTTMAAGTPTSGYRSQWFANYWIIQGLNDSAITCAHDTANTDPGNQSGVDVLINVSTVQANDAVAIWQQLTPGLGTLTGQFDLSKLAGAPLSVSVRAKAISGNPQMSICMLNNDGTQHLIQGPWVPLTNAYATYKFENQIGVPNNNVWQFILQIQFKGVGQLALDNVMLNVGSVATSYRPKINPPRVVENLARNPGLESWQRGSGPFSANGQYCADGWYIALSGSNAVNVAPEYTTVDNNSKTSMHASIANGATLVYRVAAADGFALAGKVVTVQVRVWALGPDITLNLYNQDVTTNVAYSNKLSQTWETITVTVPLSASTTALSITIGSNISEQLYIDNFMIYYGFPAAEYNPLPPADDIARCLRYYEVFGNVSASVPQMCGYSVGQTTILLPFKARKAAVPTATKVNTWTATNCAQPTFLPDYDVSLMYTAVSPLGNFVCQPQGTPLGYATFETNP